MKISAEFDNNILSQLVIDDKPFSIADAQAKVKELRDQADDIENVIRRMQPRKKRQEKKA